MRLMIQGKSPWDFCCSWFSVGEIMDSIRRHSRGLRGAPEERPMPNDDVRSHEFAVWLTEGYRLAMIKGIEMAQRESADQFANLTAERDALLVKLNVARSQRNAAAHEQKIAKDSREWYARRCEKIQELQKHVPDPYRTVICNVLANDAFDSMDRPVEEALKHAPASELKTMLVHALRCVDEALVLCPGVEQLGGDKFKAVIKMAREHVLMQEMIERRGQGYGYYWQVPSLKATLKYHLSTEDWSIAEPEVPHLTWRRMIEALRALLRSRDAS